MQPAAAPALPAPPPVADLAAFGWAPGLYMRSGCRDCGQQVWGCTKRSWRCESCAGLARDAAREREACPLICDRPDLLDA